MKLFVVTLAVKCHTQLKSLSCKTNICLVLLTFGCLQALEEALYLNLNKVLNFLKIYEIVVWS